MGLLDISSGDSLYRGKEYYEKKRVLSFNQIDDSTYQGVVKGTSDNYDVVIDILHPRKSHCNCPHANGRRIICKHMVALYFGAVPDAYDDFVEDEKENEEEYEEYQKDVVKYLKQYIDSLKKDELKELLNAILSEDLYYNHYKYLYREFYDFLYEKLEEKKIKLKLSTVVETLNMISEFSDIYVDIETNEILEVNDVYFPEEENEKILRKVNRKPDRYLSIDYYEYQRYSYSCLIDFIDSLEDVKIADKMYELVRGKGAFSKFNYAIREYKLEDRWYKFKEKALARKAKELLSYNDLKYIDDIKK